MKNPIPFYMAPATSADLLAQSRAFTDARRADRAQRIAQAAECDRAYRQCLRLGWDDENARAMAQIKVYGVPA